MFSEKTHPGGQVYSRNMLLERTHLKFRQGGEDFVQLCLHRPITSSRAASLRFSLDLYTKHHRHKLLLTLFEIILKRMKTTLFIICSQAAPAHLTSFIGYPALIQILC